ncbi:hypothetical protein Dimus_012835 [Dionaea muscipula]
METWFAILVTICSIAIFKSLLDMLRDGDARPELEGKKHKLQRRRLPLPPGPSSIPLISLLGWIGITGHEIEDKIRSLFSKYGPIITFTIGSTPTILISSRTLAHQALVENGAIFADRPVSSSPASKLMTSNQHNINSARYGPTWRLLRRNLMAFIHPSRVKEHYSQSRKRALQILIDRLKVMSTEGDNSDAAVEVLDHLQHALFVLLAFMCYGERLLDEEQYSIQPMEEAIRRLLRSGNRFQMLDLFLPAVLAKTLFYRLWREYLGMRKDIEEAMSPLIRARKQKLEDQGGGGDHYESDDPAYMDTLFEVELEEDGIGGKRKLTEDELVSISLEFVTVGSDTTSAVLLWIMANLVKYPDIQAKLFEEIKGVIGSEEVREEDLPKMPYLRAVILEGLRRHPPGHFVLPHMVSEEAELGGYRVPKGAQVNVMMSEIAWDPELWDEPMRFKPERFLEKEGETVFDITGSREIRMMPFGVGRRICPGYALAMMHLEYFVANLVLKFEWKAMEGEEIDLTEKYEPFIVMKHPLRAQISARI